MRHHWIESELSKLSGLILAVDEHLSEVCDKSVAAEDSDAFGLFDSAEHATGLGFVACQTYMATLCGALMIEKSRALSLGPTHSGGLTMVQVINHAANYWKHNNEWSLDKSAARQEAIHRAFDSVGFPVGTDYPLSGVLTELSGVFPAALKQLIPILEEWKAAMYNAT